MNKELTHMVMRNPKICSWQARTQKSYWCSFSLKAGKANVLTQLIRPKKFPLTQLSCSIQVFN